MQTKKNKNKNEIVENDQYFRSNTTTPPSVKEYNISKESSIKSSSTYQPEPIPQQPYFEDHLQFPREISEDYNVLKLSGLLDAYQLFLKNIIKNGLPNGPIYQYAAQEMEKYEKRKLNKELRMKAELDIQRFGKKGSKEKNGDNKNQKVTLPYRPH